MSSEANHVKDELVQQLRVSVEKVRIALHDLEEMRTSGKERVAAFCDFMRNDIDVTAESKIEEIRKQINEQRIRLIEEVDEYRLGAPEGDSTRSGLPHGEQ